MIAAMLLAASIAAGEPARFVDPLALAFDAAGNLYVADRGDSTIRRIEPDGRVTTFAGLSGESGLVDGRGGAARFSGPRGLAFDERGNLWVADSGNHAVRRIAPDGSVRTIVAKTKVDANTIVGELAMPVSIAFERDGTVLIADFHEIWAVGRDRRVSKRFTRAGLPKTQHIARILVDADDALLLFDGDDLVARRRTLGWSTVAGDTEGGRGIPLSRPQDGAFAPDGTLVLATAGFTTTVPLANTNSYGLSNDAMHALRPDGTWRKIPGRPAKAIAIDGKGRIALIDDDTGEIWSIANGTMERIATKHPLEREPFELVSIPPGGTVTLANARLTRIPSHSRATVVDGVLRPDVADVFELESGARRLRVTVVAPASWSTLADGLLAQRVAPAPSKERVVPIRKPAEVPPDADAATVVRTLGWQMQDPAARQRVLAAIDEQPELVLRVLDGFRPDPEIVERFKKIHDALQRKHGADDDRVKHLRYWLTVNSSYFRDELLRLIEATSEEYVDSSNHLSRFAARDWAGARPVLLRWSGSDSARRRAIALQIRYERALKHGDEDRDAVRAALQKLVEDRAAPGIARWTALDALTIRVEGNQYVPERVGWPGREEWFLSLFDDPTLVEVRDFNNVRSPLTHLVTADPESWTPRVVPLLRDERTRANAAVALLDVLQRSLDPRPSTPQPSTETAKQIVRALLPWIVQPSWAPETMRGTRASLIADAVRLGVTEAVPALRDAPKSVPVLNALAAFGDRDAMRELRSALLEQNESERRPAYDTLAASPLVDAGEQAAAVEAWLRFERDPQNTAMVTGVWGAKLPFEPGLGHHLTLNITLYPAVAAALAERLPSLRQRDPSVAKSVLALLASTGGAVAPVVLREIAGGHADEIAVAAVLARPGEYEAAARELLRGAAFAPEASAILGVVAGDATLVTELLREGKTTARLALAAARLAQLELPFRDAHALDRAGPDAADAYLAAIDTPAARAALHARHPGRVMFSGVPYAGAGCCCRFTAREDEYRNEVADGKTDELVALLTWSGGPCGYEGPPVVIRFRGRTAELVAAAYRREKTHTTVSPEGTRFHLTARQTHELRELLDAWNAGSGKAAVPVGWESAIHELVHVTKNGARRQVILTDYATLPPPLFEWIRRLSETPAPPQAHGNADGIAAVLATLILALARSRA